jgi:hypothetical protein
MPSLFVAFGAPGALALRRRSAYLGMWSRTLQ